MITGILLLLWGIGVTVLAFKMQTHIQEAAEPEWRHARELYDQAPFVFCSCMFVALALWPAILAFMIYKAVARKGN